MQQLESGILVPAANRIVIRPRVAPRPRLGAGMGGWIEWRLVDRRGRAIRGGEQHNLFLNQGLDHVATFSLGITHTNFFQKAAVGTDSTTPDPTDVALGNQVGITTTTIGGSGDWSRTGDGVYVFTVTYEFDFNEANGNLTEWAIISSSDTPIARELFRDGLGDPTTVTKTSNEKLRITYNFQLSLSPVVLTPGSFTLTGIGLINGDYMWRGGVAAPGNYSQRDLYAFAGIAADRQTSTSGLLNADNVVDSGVYADANGPGMARLGSSQTERPTTQTPSTYVAGTYTRSATGFWGTAQAQYTVATLGVQGQTNNSTEARTGFVFVIDEGDRFTKDDEHTLTINDLCTVTWGRDE